MSAGWKKKVSVGKLAIQPAAQLADVVPGGAVLAGPQRDQDLAVERADGGAVAEGDVEAAVGQADVVENIGQLVRRESRGEWCPPPCENQASVSSMRVPAGARTWRRIWPASTGGEEIRADEGSQRRAGQRRARRNEAITTLRCASEAASSRR